MDAVTEQLLIALLANGHVLLEGVPGVAKTTLSKAFARLHEEAVLARGQAEGGFVPVERPFGPGGELRVPPGGPPGLELFQLL